MHRHAMLRLTRSAALHVSLIAGLAIHSVAENSGSVVGFRVCDDVNEPSSLDPFAVFSEKSLTILQQFVEGLLKFGPKGEIQPALAESWSQIDPVTYQFRLRKGVVFHNGEALDAAAVKFSLERYIAPETQFPGYPFVSSLNRVDVIDAHTVNIVTNYPDGLLLNRLAAFLYIVPPKYYTEVGSAAFSNHPVGTGPFKFDSWDKTKKIVLSKNENYWLTGFPLAKKLEFQFIPELNQFDTLKMGKVDLVTGMPGTFTLRVMENPTTIVKKAASLSTVTIILNANEGNALADKRVRLALAHSINRNDFIQYDAFTNATPLVSVTAAGAPGHNPELAPISFDVAKAKALLKEAGFDAAHPLKLKFLGVPHSKRASGIVKKHFEEVGVAVDVVIVPETDIVPTFMKGGWDAAIANLPNPMAHAYFPLSLLFYSKSPFSLLKSPEVDRRLEEAVATIDPAAQEAKFRELDKFIHDNVLGIGIYQRIKTFGVSRRVSFTPYVTGMPHFFDARTGVVNTRKTAE